MGYLEKERKSSSIQMEISRIKKQLENFPTIAQGHDRLVFRREYVSGHLWRFIESSLDCLQIIQKVGIPHQFYPLSENSVNPAHLYWRLNEMEMAKSRQERDEQLLIDRKSTRLNSSHL